MHSSLTLVTLFVFYIYVLNIKINKSKKCFYMAIVNFIAALPCGALVVQFI